MTKNEAIKLFGTAAELARAVGLTRGRISQWPEKLEQKQADLVRGAALRLGKLPAQASHINDALNNDGKISDAELQTIEKDLQECVEALVVLRDQVREKNKADFHGADQ